MTLRTLASTFILMIFCLMSCSDKSSDAKYSKLEISDRLIEQYSSSEKGVGFSHNLILKNFNPDLDTVNNLIAFADNYIDTVATDKPIFSITICKPCKSESYHDSRAIGPIRDHAIVSIDYDSYDPTFDRLPIIKGMTLWIDGKPTYISPFDKDERLKGLKYYQTHDH